MTGIGEGAASAAKGLEVIKDLPLWVFLGLTISALALLFAPGIASAVPAAGRPWIIVAGVCSGGLALARAAALLTEQIPKWRLARVARRKFYITAVPEQSFWHTPKQPDGSVTTQVAARLFVKNLTNSRLALVSARLVKPRVRGEMMHNDVSMQAPDSNIYGTACGSGHAIPPSMSLPVSVHMMIRGVPWREPKNKIRVTIAVRDDEGREERVKMTMRVVPRPGVVAALPVLEVVSSLADPTERQVAAVLQAEIARYDKCGRSVGGLGSIHLVIDGRAITGVGNDSWNPNSPKNQSLYENPDGVELKSDNLGALMAYYSRLSEGERGRFEAALLDRIGEDLDYLRVAYFIVCALWKAGNLREALERAKAKLPQGEMNAFGLSNTLMLLNGLLRYRYPDFSNELLDEIEKFLKGMNEHAFQIPEKIAAIRTMRLREL
jgi:hypothetical protein